MSVPATPCVFNAPGQPDGTPPPLETALSYHAAGLSVIPVKLDGSKAPDLPAWTEYMGRQATEAEVRGWFGRRPRGIGVACGKGSGNVELLDFDAEADAIFPQWRELVEAEAPGLVDRLTRIRTGGGGLHLPYRVDGPPVPGNLKLALDPARPKDDQVLIETRGQGGQFVAPGSPLEVHRSRRPYVVIAGPPLTGVAVVSAAEREVLIRCSRFFDRRPAAANKGGARTARGKGQGLKPGEDFDARGPDWSEILGPHGWSEVGRAAGKRLWRRPGKDVGWSATTGYCSSEDGTDLFYVFSSNAAPFEEDKAYGKFRVFSFLNHDRDLSAAARALAAQGYGEQVRRNGRAKGPGGEPAACKDKPPELRPLAVGPLLVAPGSPRRTPSKLALPVTIRRDGEALAECVVTTSASGCKEALRLLAMFAGGLEPEARQQAEQGLLRMLAAAGAVADQARHQADGPTLLEVLRERVPPAFALAYRTERGAWSELQGREVTRAEFVSYTPEDLVRAASEASDVPRTFGGGPAPMGEVVRAIETGLRVLWASLVPALPLQVDADLRGESQAAQAFRNALEALWKRPTTFEVERGSDGNSVASRASLVSRVTYQQRKLLKAQHGHGRWHRIHQAFSAWWRCDITPGDGEEITVLGLRWELAGQVGVDLPGVTGQPALTTLAGRYGVLQPGAKRLTDGGRLTVLSSDFTRELLKDAADLEADPVPGDAAEPGENDAEACHSEGTF